MKNNKINLSDLQKTNDRNYSYSKDSDIISILEKNCKNVNAISIDIPFKKKWEQRALNLQSIIVKYYKSLSEMEYTSLIRSIQTITNLKKEWELYRYDLVKEYDSDTSNIKYQKWLSSYKNFVFKNQFSPSQCAYDILIENKHLILKQNESKFN